jgi:transcription elongation factor GreA
MQYTPMTKQGAEALQAELNDLKMVQRPKIAKDIAIAREHGDLKENAEYHAAREQQGFLEGRLQDIEFKLGQVQIIDVTNMKNTGKVIFGTTVDLVNLENDEEVTYQIVGDDEAEIKINKISVNSPIARALIGKEEGDVAVVRTPKGEVEYEISAVQYI